MSGYQRLSLYTRGSPSIGRSILFAIQTGTTVQTVQELVIFRIFTHGTYGIA